MSHIFLSVFLSLTPSVWSPPRFVAPVVAPIYDHFRPPACSWCPGNRGIDYAAEPGGQVHAAASGVVEFAGPVGKSLFVVVRHPDGLRTTYGFLQAVSVTAGLGVATGDVVGRSGPDLHFGVRRGDTYLDPEPFLAGQRLKARLVA